MTPDRVIQTLLEKGKAWPRMHIGCLESNHYFDLSYGGIDGQAEIKQKFNTWQALVDFAEGYRRNEILYRRFRP